MAIAKMNKVSLVAPLSLQDSLLQSIQELKSLEPLSLGEAQEALSGLGPKSGANEGIESALSQVEAGLDFLKKHQKQESALKKLRQLPSSYSLEDLQVQSTSQDLQASLSKVKAYQDQLQKLEDQTREALEKEKLLRKWGKLDFPPKAIFKHKTTKTKMGTIPQSPDNRYLNMLLESDRVAVKEIYHDKDEIGLLVTFQRRYQESIRPLLAQANFSIVWYPFEGTPKEELAKNLAWQKDLAQAKTSLLGQIGQDQALKDHLTKQATLLGSQLQRAKAKDLLAQGQDIFLLTGWMTQKEALHLQDQLETAYPDSPLALLVEEIDQEDYDQVPVVLENNKVFSAFESITQMYGMPKYGDMDPTPWTAPFYLCFFGMMSADIGYGLLLWLGTLVALKFLHFPASTKKNLLFFHYLSYPTILWGIIFGSFFGIEMPFTVLSLTKDLTTIMVLSIIFGVIQIMVGLAIGAYGNLKKKAYADAYQSHIGWFAIILGIILYVVGAMLVKVPAIAFIGKWMAIIAAIGIVLVAVLTATNKWAGLASGLYNLYGISGYVGDVVSYTRLMALAVSGGSIASAFNLLVSFLPPVGRFTLGVVLILLLHALNIFLTYLGAYVHGLRLQFVEYYGKFYGAGGRSLDPLTPEEKYLSIQPKQVNSKSSK